MREIRLSSTQDKESLEILEELQNSNKSSTQRLSSSDRVLSESETKVLEKRLDFVSFQRKVNEPEFRRDFEEFCRRMKIKWYFRNKIYEVQVFSHKSSWNPPQGHLNLEGYLSQVENELFSIADEPIR